MSSVLTVSQINTYIKSVIDSDLNLKHIYVSGEISNFTDHYRSGHFYFTLKDSSAAIKAVMFRSAAERVRFRPENGMRVVIRGGISVFERDGVYQLYCDEMIPDGQGALSLAFEQLKKKLFEQGLFDETHKTPLPAYPQRIGVITSPTGAAVHDILTVLERRFPLAAVVFEPVAVQGELAAPQIITAIEKFNRYKACDVLIVGRGGGSIEDLWAFNEEAVAYAIYDSEIPVISAVGHETDFTIADFVADCRAPTPSAAAEIAVPDYREVLYALDGALDSMTAAMEKKLSATKEKLFQAEKLLSAYSPALRVDRLSQMLEMLSKRLLLAGDSCLSSSRSALSTLVSRLESASPLKTLERGFAAVTKESGEMLKSAEKVSVGEKLAVRFFDGVVTCTADKIDIQNRKDEENGSI